MRSMLMLCLCLVLAAPAARPASAEEDASGLRDAVRNGDAEVVEKYLKEKGDPDLKDETGRSLLLQTCQYAGEESREGRIAIARLLIAAGADVNGRDSADREDGRTALMTAAMYGHMQIVAMLADAGAKIDARDREGRTALMYADTEKPELWRFLISKKADVNAVSDGCPKCTPLGRAIGKPELVKMLLDAGARISAAGNGEESCLSMAASSGAVDTMKLLVKAGADVNERFSCSFVDGRTALISASAAGKIEAVKFLLAFRARTDLVCTERAVFPEYEGSAMMLAAKNGHADIVKMLIAAKAGLETEDHSGRTVLMIAADSGSEELVDMLLKARADVRHQDTCGSTALFHAAESGYADIARRLIDAGADVRHRDAEGATVLMRCAKDSPETWKLLIARGAEVSAVSPTRSTPLWNALERPLLVKMLLDAGADVSVRLQDGDTCLMLAAYAGNTETVKLLLSAGADPDARNDAGKAAAEIAAEQGHDDTAAVLKAARRVTGPGKTR